MNDLGIKICLIILGLCFLLKVYEKDIKNMDWYKNHKCEYCMEK